MPHFCKSEAKEVKQIIEQLVGLGEYDNKKEKTKRERQGMLAVSRLILSRNAM